jgi:hypothetical protein
VLNTLTHDKRQASEMPRFSKGDRVRAKATLFDGGEETRDRNELLFSEKWAADKNEEWCCGTASFVYAR